MAGEQAREETPKGMKHPRKERNTLGCKGNRPPGGSSAPPAAGRGQGMAAPTPRCPAAPPPRPYLADEVDAEEDLPGGLQRAAAGLLPVQLARSAGQDEEAADDGDGP